VQKKVAILTGILVLFSAAYDFWRGYHESKSVLGGIVYVVLGFGVLGLIWCISSFARSK
jgi:hypothetical protein